MPPINDNFANRVVLSGEIGLDGPYVIDDATTEVGEQTGSAILNAHKTVWWEWTAPANGTVTFETQPSSVADTNLAIWTGTTLGSLTEVGSNEDANHPVGFDWARVTFTAVSGTTYLIQAGPFSALATGSITIAWAMEAANDDFADRFTITGDTGSAPCVPIGAATTEGSEPTGSALSNGIHQTLWYEWTAPGDGSVTFDTELSYPIDTTLAVWTGGSLGTLVEVASDDDSGSVGSTSKVTFTAVSGTVYKIQLGTYDGTGTGCAILRWGGTLTPPTADYDLTASVSSVTLDTAEIASFTITLDVHTPPHTVTVNSSETNLADVDVRYTPGRPHLTNYTNDVTWTITVEATPLTATKTGHITFVASDGVTDVTVVVDIIVLDPSGVHVRKREALKNIICLTTPEEDGGLRHFLDGNGDTNALDHDVRLCGGVQHGDWPRFWFIDKRGGDGVPRVGVVAVNTGSMGVRWMGEPFWIGRDDISYVPVGTTPDVTPILGFDPQSVQLVSDGTYLYCVALIYVQDDGFKDVTELRNGDYTTGFGADPVLKTARLACWRWEGGDDVGGETWSDWGWDDRILLNQGGEVPSNFDDPFNPRFGYSAPGLARTLGDVASASPVNTGMVHGVWMEEGPGAPYNAVEGSSSPGAFGVTNHFMTWSNYHRIVKAVRFTGPGQIDEGADLTILQDLATPSFGQSTFTAPYKDYLQVALGTAGGTALGVFCYDIEDELSTTLFSLTEVLNIVDATLINDDLPSVTWACLPGVAPPTPGTGLLGNPGIMTVSDPQGSGITYADWIDHGYTWITFQAVNRPATLSPDLTAAQAAGFTDGVGVWGVVYDLGDFYDFGVALGTQAIALGADHVIVDAEFCLEHTRVGNLAQPIIDGLADGGWTGPVHLSTLGSPSDPVAFDFEMDFASFLATGGGVLPQSYSNETRDYDAANCAIYWQRLGVPPEMLNYTIGLYTGALGRLSGADYLPLLQEAGVVHNFSIFLGETATTSDIDDLDVLTVATDTPPDPGTGPCEPPETECPLRLYWGEETGVYYTITSDVTTGYGDFHRLVTLSADGTTWGRLFRNGIDVSTIGHRITSVIGPFGFIASYDSRLGAVIGVEGDGGPVYIWVDGTHASNGVEAGAILYGWNPCPAPGPRNSLAWGPYKIGNLSPFYGNPDVGDTTDTLGPYPDPQNFVAVTGNPNAVNYNLEEPTWSAVKIGNFVYVITDETNRDFVNHPAWDDNHQDFRLYRFEIQSNLDSNTCPPLVPTGTTPGFHVWQRYTT